MFDLLYTGSPMVKSGCLPSPFGVPLCCQISDQAGCNTDCVCETVNLMLQHLVHLPVTDKQVHMPDADDQVCTIGTTNCTVPFLLLVDSFKVVLQTFVTSVWMCCMSNSV